MSIKIFNFIIPLVLPFIYLTGLSASQTDPLKNRMKAELDTLRNIFAIRYAPREWKKQQSGWDLNAEIAQAKERVDSLEKIDVKSFQRILKDFMNSAQDYHVNIYFHSTEAATLPFRVKGVDGKYFISFIDRMRLSSAVYPFSVGDELIYFDGSPTDEIVQEIKMNEERHANANTDSSFAEFYLTNRFGFKGQPVPKTPVSIGVKSLEKIHFYQLYWDYKPEKILSPVKGLLQTTSPRRRVIPKILKKHPLLDASMEAPLFEQLQETHANIAERNKDLLGSRESFLPILGKVWWKTEQESLFYAYVYETKEKNRIGYLRIPHFRGSEAHIDELSEILAFFAEHTDALVIDQFNNPGGNAQFMYAVLSMLTENALSTPKHRRMITQKEVASAIKDLQTLESVQSDSDAQEILGKSLFGIPITYQYVQSYLQYCRFIVEEWNAGRSFTDPCYVCAMDQINPHPNVRYTKPILLLINDLDISCGDFFPAILQDNKRAVTLGTKTAGAGGIVETISYPNAFGVSTISYTVSLAERIDKVPIENIGVTPDVEYKMTEADLQNNYCGYVKAINDILHSMILGNK